MDFDDCEDGPEETKAPVERTHQEQGIFEEEVFEGDEVDLHEHLTSCTKNPGHHKFIPVNKFTVEHLPPRYQDDTMMRFIKALSDITVCITVEHISKKRPTTDKLYASAFSGKSRTGSGWIWRVNVFSYRNYNKKTCPCNECRRSQWPMLQWAVIDIYTAAHLVYNEKEDAHTKCQFFYDSNDLNKKSLLSVRGTTRVENNEAYGKDTCRLTYIIHDIALGNKLKNMWTLYRGLHKEVGEKFNKIEEDNETELEQNTDKDHKLVIIVSHPHGCSKQISIGEYTDRQEKEYNDAYTQYYYTTPTCNGSSGAPVYILSRWWWWGCDHPHSGSCSDDKELNYSGVAMY